MDWLADECVDADLVARLRGTGHDVWYIAELASGSTDAEVVRRANDNRRLVLTQDKDFGELVFRSGLPVPGVVLLRLDVEQRMLRWTRLECAIEQFGERLFGRYLVIEATRFRSRPLRS